MYSFTEDQQGARTDLTSSEITGSRYSVSAFAKLRLNGFKSDQTIRNYRKLWTEHGDPDIQPGDKVFLPERTGPDPSRWLVRR